MKRLFQSCKWLILAILVSPVLLSGHDTVKVIINGNAGYEGNPNPVVNLHQAAQKNGYGGNSGEGGGFWSTRFSAGNSYAGNQTGYVSLPGGGMVGYGN